VGVYQIRGEETLQRIHERPEVWNDWLILAEGLSEDPRNPAVGDPLRDTEARPGTYSASFDEAVLLYQVMADFPIVELLQVTWLSDFFASEWDRPPQSN
jgi:hypothetical protein